MQDYCCFEMRRFTQSVTMTDPFQITVLFVTLTFTQQDHWLRSETFFIFKPLIMIRLLGCVTHVDSVCFYVKKQNKKNLVYFGLCTYSISMHSYWQTTYSLLCVCIIIQCSRAKPLVIISFSTAPIKPWHRNHNLGRVRGLAAPFWFSMPISPGISSRHPLD